MRDVTAYKTFCEQNKERLDFQLMRCINDATWHESFCIVGSNIRCDGVNFYIADRMIYTRFTRGDFRRRVAMLAKVFGRKPRFTGTENNLGHTRLIYKF